MKSVLDSDLLGPTARCHHVDDAMAADVPMLKAVQPGTRLTRALALYSFGAKPGEDRGVLRNDLLMATQVPGFTADLADTALQSLSETLLYIHTSGRRYRFEKKPNLNKLVDDEAKKLSAEEVLGALKVELEGSLGSKSGYYIWPATSDQVTDGQTRFHVAFLGVEHALENPEEIEKLCRKWTEMCGNAKRKYKNGIAFAVPSPGAMDNARTIARRALALDRLLADKKRHGFDADDVADLQARRQRAGTDLSAAMRQLYPVILLPVAAPANDQDPIRLQRFDIQSYQALGSGLLGSIYKVLENWVFEDAKPMKLVSCVRLGDGEQGSKAHWISGPELVDQFFSSVHFPKLLTLVGVKRTVGVGVQHGKLGYILGAKETKGGLELLSEDSLVFGDKDAQWEDIDLSAGSYVVSATLAKELAAKIGKPVPVTPPAPGKSSSGEPLPPESTPVAPTGGGSTSSGPLNQVHLHFRAKGGQLYSAFNALQVLSEWAGNDFVANVQVCASADKPLDRNLYETAVVMALEEENIEVGKK